VALTTIGSITRPIEILLVEDNPGDKVLIKEFLQSCRYIDFELTDASRLSEALQSISKREPDVILLDLGLPDSQGLETVTRIGSKARFPAIVVLTGQKDESVGMEAVRQGAQDYLVKGQVTSDAIERAIQYSLERKKTEILAEALNDINKDVNSVQDVNEILDQVLVKAKSAVGSDSALLALIDGNQWTLEYGVNLPSGSKGQRFPLNDFIMKGLENERPLIIADTETEEGVSAEVVKKFDIKTALIIPLKIIGQIIGFVSFIYTSHPRTFSRAQIDFVDKLAVSLSLGIESSRLFESERSQRMLLQAITDNAPAAMILVDGVDWRVKWTNGVYQEYLDEPWRSRGRPPRQQK